VPCSTWTYVKSPPPSLPPSLPSFPLEYNNLPTTALGAMQYLDMCKIAIKPGARVLGRQGGREGGRGEGGREG